LSLAYLSLGSNLGNKQLHLLEALVFIEGRAGTILSLSKNFETQPWGYRSGNLYLNAVISVETHLIPEDLLAVTQQIEQDLGRRRKTVNNKYQDREIDIDILLYDDLILQIPALTIPHPLMHQRAFVLKPLSEIAPHLIHPILGKTIAEIYNDLHYQSSLIKDTP
jgi:2-amino-4-hydroxy-6-hydroxymethyldihydropteridine diphosphokinase